MQALAASPETMLAPGVPTSVAHDTAAHADDERHVRSARRRFTPAAAFDVIDLDPAKMSGGPRLHVCGTVA